MQLQDKINVIKVDVVLTYGNIIKYNGILGTYQWQSNTLNDIMLQ